MPFNILIFICVSFIALELAAFSSLYPSIWLGIGLLYHETAHPMHELFFAYMRAHMMVDGSV